MLLVCSAACFRHGLVGHWPSLVESNTSCALVCWGRREALAREEVPHGVIAQGVSTIGQGAHHASIAPGTVLLRQTPTPQCLPCSVDPCPRLRRLTEAWHPALVSAPQSCLWGGHTGPGDRLRPPPQSSGPLGLHLTTRVMPPAARVCGPPLALRRHHRTPRAFRT